MLSVLHECCHLSMVSGLGFKSHSGNNIPYTLPEEISQNVCVYVNVILRGYPEHIPVCVIKILTHGFRLVRPALHSP